MLLVLAGGCGEREEPRTEAETEPFTVALDFYVNPDHAGLFTALERGYFEQAGLEVDAQVPPTPLPRSARPRRVVRISRSPTSPRCCSPATRACR